MSKMKRFIETAGVYLIGNVLSKLIGFFLLPLYTSALSPDQFGTYDLVVSVIILFVPVVFFQIWDGMFRAAFDQQKSTDKYSVISNSFAVWVLGVLLYSMVFWTGFNAFRFENAFLVFIYGLGIASSYQYTYIARAFLSNRLFVLSGLINSLLSAIINIVLLVKFNVGIQSLYIAPVLGCVAQVLMIEMALHPLRSLRVHDIKLDYIRVMLKFSVPLCIATVSYWLLSGYTKVIISQQLGTHENGLYAVANRFSAIITLVISAFQYAWNEMAYLMAQDDNRIAKYEKSIQYMLKVVMLGSGVLMLAVKLVFPYLIDIAYQEALAILPISLIGVAVNAFASFVSTIFLTEKQTKWILWTTIIAAVINILCAWVFTLLWGLQGANGALCLSFTVLALLRIYAIRRMFSIKLSWSSLINFFMLGISVYVFYVVDTIKWLVVITILFCGISVYSLRDMLFALCRGVAEKGNDLKL